VGYVGYEGNEWIDSLLSAGPRLTRSMLDTPADERRDGNPRYYVSENLYGPDGLAHRSNF
jgi:hypothetical protein